LIDKNIYICYMESVISNLIQAVDNPWLISTVVLITIIVWLTKDGWVSLIKKIDVNKINFSLKKKNSFTYKIQDLKNHDLFTTLEALKNTKMPDFYHGEDLDSSKSKIFSDFISCKMESTKENMMSISQKANNEMSRMELKNHVHNCFIECNLGLEKRLKNKFMANNLTEEQAIKVINKFYEIRGEAIKKYNERIDSIFACDFYENNFQLILSLYEVIAFEVKDIVEDSHEAFRDINGMFFKLDYRMNV